MGAYAHSQGFEEETSFKSHNYSCPRHEIECAVNIDNCQWKTCVLRLTATTVSFMEVESVRRESKGLERGL